MKWEVEVLGTEKLAATFGDKMPRVYKRNLFEGMNRAMIMFSSYIKANKLSGQVLKNRTGELRRGINWLVKETSSAIEGKTGTNVVYAKTHEKGATIFPKIKKVLHWIGDDGQPRFAKFVRIPRRSFLESAYEDKKRAIFDELKAAGLRAASEMGR